eukprot:TRINITY_DN1827_c0_g1_i2.p1 TRINITY_DN1827_c0_g1~~TRINITY_DN1827_c0_g1_i2.p1  ORF type:complete len:366 (+),score=83.27 TRINITY_DN1827_c0_g1_i2:40-1137(+)
MLLAALETEAAQLRQEVEYYEGERGRLSAWTLDHTLTPRVEALRRVAGQIEVVRKEQEQHKGFSSSNTLANAPAGLHVTPSVNLRLSTTIDRAGDTNPKLRASLLVCSLTGNTMHIASELATALRKKENTEYVDVINITGPTAPNFTPLEYSNVIGVGAPTWYGGAPPQVTLFVNSLQDSLFTGKKAFVFCTGSAPNSQCCLHMAALLRAKGAKVIATFTALAPNSFPPNIPAGKKQLWGKRDRAKLGAFVDNLHNLFEKTNVPVLSARVHSQQPTGAATGVAVKVDEAKCAGCGTCARVCPFGAIVMHTSSSGAVVPVIGRSSCVLCYRCVNYCPKHALGDPKEGTYRFAISVLEDGDFTTKIV